MVSRHVCGYVSRRQPMSSPAPEFPPFNGLDVTMSFVDKLITSNSGVEYTSFILTISFHMKIPYIFQTAANNSVCVTAAFSNHQS